MSSVGTFHHHVGAALFTGFRTIVNDGEIACLSLQLGVELAFAPSRAAPRCFRAIINELGAERAKAFEHGTQASSCERRKQQCGVAHDLPALP